MKFNKYLAGGVFLVSASFSLPSYAGVNSASVSITVIPATQTLSCYAPKGSDGCSVNLLAGLRSSSSVLIYIDYNHCPIRNTYYVSASGITADIVDNNDFLHVIEAIWMIGEVDMVLQHLL